MEGAVIFACIFLSAMSAGMFVLTSVGMAHLGRIAEALERIVEEEDPSDWRAAREADGERFDEGGAGWEA